MQTRKLPGLDLVGNWKVCEGRILWPFFLSPCFNINLSTVMCAFDESLSAHSKSICLKSAGAATGTVLSRSNWTILLAIIKFAVTCQLTWLRLPLITIITFVILLFFFLIYEKRAHMIVWWRMIGMPQMAYYCGYWAQCFVNCLHFTVDTRKYWIRIKLYVGTYFIYRIWLMNQLANMFTISKWRDAYARDLYFYHWKTVSSAQNNQRSFCENHSNCNPIAFPDSICLNAEISNQIKMHRDKVSESIEFISQLRQRNTITF